MNNLTALAELLNSQMQKVRKAGERVYIEFGTIGGELELTVDSLRDVIPKGDYLVSLHLVGLTGDDLRSIVIAHDHAGGEHSQLGGSGNHEHHDGEHYHVLPFQLRGIKPGDRVLVVWVGGQPVVVDILAGSKELTLDGR